MVESDKMDLSSKGGQQMEKKKIEVYPYKYDKDDIIIVVEGKKDFFGRLYNFGIYAYSKKGYKLGKSVIHKLKQLDPERFGLKTKKVFFQYKKTAEKYAQQINEKIQNDEITRL